jgi:Protein of unknown function (DUF2911)
MKSFLLLLGAALMTVSLACGQGRARSTESVTINGKTISVNYSAPSVNGRQGKLFGKDGRIGQDPNYPIWRAGANAATTFHTDADLDVAGLAVPKGDYTLYVDLTDPENWKLIFSKQTGQWGLTYNADQDLGRVKMTMSKPSALVEQLKYKLTDLGGNKGKLELSWENHIAAVNFTVK